MKDQTAVRQRGFSTLARLVPLAGVAYCVFILAGDLTIGEFPDATTSPAELSRYYATHADSVRVGWRAGAGSDFASVSAGSTGREAPCL